MTLNALDMRCHPKINTGLTMGWPPITMHQTHSLYCTEHLLHIMRLTYFLELISGCNKIVHIFSLPFCMCEIHYVDLALTNGRKTEGFFTIQVTFVTERTPNKFGCGGSFLQLPYFLVMIQNGTDFPQLIIIYWVNYGFTIVLRGIWQLDIECGVD